MKRGFDRRYLLGAALLAAVAAVLVAAFFLMSRAVLEDTLLADSPGERYGWRYELLVDGEARPYELAFEDGASRPSLPEGTRAVRISRTMAEEIPHADLEWHSYRDGVEVFLDGELLHSDFRGEVLRGEDGFLRPTDGDWQWLHRKQGDVWQRVRISLPADYLGMELCVVTYFPEDWGIPVPEYPYLGSEDSFVASFIVTSMKHDVSMTVLALVALLIAAVFLMDIPNGGANGGTALLCLYFLLLFLNRAAASFAGNYSELNARLDLSLLHELYVVPLYLYLALRLKKRWRYPLCGAIVAWALYAGVRWYLEQRGHPGTAGRIGPWALAVFLLVAAASCADGIARARQARRSEKRLADYAAVLGVAAIAAVNLINRIHAWGSARAYFVNGIWSALRVGSFEPLVNLTTDIVSTISLFAVISEFVRRTLRTRQEVSVLQERARQTMEGYQRLLTAENATSALHHEMRHHMTALAGLLQNGDLQRARRYAEAVAGDLDELSTGRYSQNLLVDVIAGSFLDRAWAQRIQVEHQLNVPPELHIADEDLSVFLSNMLQNALEACERMDAAAERYIKVEMRLRGNFLFIRCANSAAAEGASRRARPGHGYGLAAMRKIAERYNSTLVIERAPGKFSVMSDLCLRER